MKQRLKAVPASYVFMIKDDRILLMRRFQSCYEDGNYSVPAGHIEQGESLTQCAVREILEETGTQVKPEDIAHAHTMYRGAENETGDRADYFFVTKKWEGTPRIMEPEKCDDMSWYPLASLPDNVIPYIRRAITDWQQGIVFSEVNFD